MNQGFKELSAVIAAQAGREDKVGCSQSSFKAAPWENAGNIFGQYTNIRGYMFLLVEEVNLRAALNQPVLNWKKRCSFSNGAYESFSLGEGSKSYLCPSLVCIKLFL